MTPIAWSLTRNFLYSPEHADQKQFKKVYWSHRERLTQCQTVGGRPLQKEDGEHFFYKT